VDQLLFPNENGDIMILDVAEDSSAPFGVKFEDQDWEQHLSCVFFLFITLDVPFKSNS